MAVPWILIAVLVVLAILAILVLFYRKKYKARTDYYSLFMIGIVWIAIGVPLKNFFLWGLGLVFMIAGLAHKNEWKKGHKTWKQLSKKEQKMKMTIMIILGVVLLVGVLLFFLFGM